MEDHIVIIVDQMFIDMHLQEAEVLVFEKCQ
jgi:hypothetical protein